MENLNKFESNSGELKQKLEEFGINTSSWGHYGYKTVDHLMNEIECHETTLCVNERGELLRLSEVVSASVFYKSDDGKLYRLREDRQVFKDGRQRIRPSSGYSVYEKIKLGEDPNDAMARGISEELGITDEVFIKYINKIDKIDDSKSYPNLTTKSMMYFFDVVINKGQFNPEGYIEEQPDKTTYFVWDLIDDINKDK